MMMSIHIMIICIMYIYIYMFYIDYRLHHLFLPEVTSQPELLKHATCLPLAYCSKNRHNFYRFTIRKSPEIMGI